MLKISKAKISMILIILILSCTKVSLAHGVTYKLKYIGENTVQVMLQGVQGGEYLQVRSISTGKGKNLTVHYAIVKDKSEAMPTVNIDCRIFALAPPVRVILSNITDENPVFHDVKGHKAEIYIQHLHDAGIINGYAGDVFKPEGGITRAEFFTMMVKALELSVDKSEANSFTDLQNHWGKNSIMAAVKNNLVKGNGDGTIRPDDPVTVGQVAVVLERAYKLQVKQQRVYTKLNNPAHYATSSVKKMLDADIILLEDDLYKNFNIDKPATRAECATMISRAMVQ